MKILIDSLIVACNGQSNRRNIISSTINGSYDVFGEPLRNIQASWYHTILSIAVLAKSVSTGV